ncbi:hypothetical protein [Pedobacter heparinus]|uniref:hypothetical protein n=1 Tax=Pedobacter heparinus TaxID=984 RepID=UPI00292E3CEB|nr:hypothetical protein [Pedobacter heparinus]
MGRLCIYPQEAARLLHVTERQAQRIFKAIRKELNKKKHQAITLKEFCEYKGFEETEVDNQLNSFTRTH